MILDRFAGFAAELRDPQDVGIRLRVRCAGCGESVENGEFVYILDDGRVVHDAYECVLSALKLERIPVEEVLS